MSKMSVRSKRTEAVAVEGQRKSTLHGETLTVSTQCLGMRPNKVIRINQETLPGTRGSGKRAAAPAHVGALLRF